MLKLIKLEIRKNNVKKYIIASFCISLGAVLICGIGIYKSATIPAEMDEIFTNWNSLVSLATTLSLAGFSILSASMHADYSVEEYIGKRSILLFSYPQKRSEILMAKCVFIFIFVSLIMIFTHILAVLLCGYITNMLMLELIPVNFGNSHIIELLKLTVISSLLASVIGLISLRIGFWFKSSTTTVMTSIILFSLFSNIIFKVVASGFYILVAASIILLLISVLLFLELLSKVNKMESV